MKVFCTGIDCSSPESGISVTGFYFAVPKQNCSHTVETRQYFGFSILVEDAKAMSEHRCFGGVDVVSQPVTARACCLPGDEHESQGRAASASSTFDPARLFQGVWK